jgi:signal transduction histidine kinase
VVAGALALTAVVELVSSAAVVNPGVDGAVAVILIVGGYAAWQRRPDSRTGPLLLLTGATWIAGTIAWPAALFWHRAPLVHTYLGYPAGRLRRRLPLGVVVASYPLSLVPRVASTPAVTLALAGGLVIAAVDGYAASSGPTRRPARLAMVTATSYAAMLAFLVVQHWRGWGGTDPALYAYDVVVAASAAALVIDLIRARWSEGTAADLVVTLGERTSGATLRDVLARAFGDPSLTIGYWVPEQGRYVADDGTPVERTRTIDDRTMIEVADGDVPVAVIVHSAQAADDPRLVASATAAARLTVANARLHAEAEERLAELASARRRLVESSDEQRRRLGSAVLHDVDSGLQRVVEHLEAARSGSTAEAGIVSLRAEVDRARRDLDAIAQGIRPTALDDGGLPAALPVLAAACPCPVDLLVDVGRLPPAVEAAIYFVCAEGLTNIAKHARADHAVVTVKSRDRTIVATIADDGSGAVDLSRGTGLRGLTDRVEALGGQLTVESHPAQGTIVTAELPAPRDERRVAP